MKTKHKLPWKELVSIYLFMILVSSGGSLETKTCGWNQSHGDESHTTYTDVDVVLPLEILWREIAPSGEISGSPVVNGDKLVIISPQTSLSHDHPPLSSMPLHYSLLCYTMDRTGLHLDWSQSLSEVLPGTTPAIVDNRVMCPSSDLLHCYDLETGYKMWETDFSSIPFTPTVVLDVSFAAITTMSGSLSLIDVADGRIVWTRDSLEDVQCQFLPLVTGGDGELFVCYRLPGEMGIAALNLQGEVVWKRAGEILHKYGGDENDYVTLYTSGILFAVDNHGTLFALDAESGDTLWTCKGDGFLDALSSDGKNLYVYSKTDEGVLCLDVETGEEIWKSPPLFPGDKDIRIVIDKSVVSTRNCIFVSLHTLLDFDPSPVFALDSKTGNIVWVSENLEDPQGPLILCNDMVIVATTTALIAFGAQSPASPPPSPSLQRPSSFITFFIVAGVFAGILVTYFLLRHKKPTLNLEILWILDLPGAAKFFINYRSKYLDILSGK